MVCLRFGGFGVRLSCADRRALEGGSPEHAWACRRAPLLGKGKVHLGHTLNSLTLSLETVWGFGAPLSVSDSMTISKRTWAHRRALVGKAAEHMGQLNFFVFFYIEEGGG